ncbi:hypothetical protein [Alkalibacterium sp.]|nr:MAG: hypothetical protein EA249_07770 [Alkalibacterium sp.]
MEIRLLADSYLKNEQLYLDFMNDSIELDKDYFSEESVFIEESPDFPIYMGRGSEKEKSASFTEAINIIMNSYIETPREIHMNGRFWHSLMITKRDYLFDLYGQLITSHKDFIRIIMKPFDWESYIYKCVLAAEYIYDTKLESEEEKQYYIQLIINNIDMYNYIIKYSIFRNSHFILNFFRAVDELGLTSLMKAKIKNRDDLGKDERYGRRVFLELNNNYPVIMAPFLQKDELKKEIVKALANYIDHETLNKIGNIKYN